MQNCFSIQISINVFNHNSLLKVDDFFVLLLWSIHCRRNTNKWECLTSEKLTSSITCLSMFEDKMWKNKKISPSIIQPCKMETLSNLRHTTKLANRPSSQEPEETAAVFSHVNFPCKCKWFCWRIHVEMHYIFNAYFTFFFFFFFFCLFMIIKIWILILNRRWIKFIDWVYL